MNALAKETFAWAVRRHAQSLEQLLGCDAMKEIRAEHPEIRLPENLCNHLMDLQCDFSQLIPPPPTPTHPTHEQHHQHYTKR